MTRAGTADEHSSMFLMPIDHEMFIRHVGVKANHCIDRSLAEFWQEGARQFLQRSDFLGQHLAIRSIRIDMHSLVMPRQLDSISKIGKAIEEFVPRVLSQVDGTALRDERVRFGGLEP